MDPIDIGVYALILGVLAPIGGLSSLGSSRVMGGHYFNSGEEKRRSMLLTLVSLDLLIGLLLSLTAFLLGPWLMARFLPGFSSEWGTFFHMAIIGNFLGLAWGGVAFHMVLRKDSKGHVLVEIFSFLSGAVLSVWGLVAGLGLFALFLGVLMTGVVRGCMCMMYIRHHGQFGDTGHWVRESVKLGLPSLPCSGLEGIKTLVERILLNQWVGLASLGIYAHSRVYHGVFFQTYKAFVKTFVPDLLESYSKGTTPDELIKQYRIVLGILTLGGVLCIGLSEPLVTLLTHGKFSEAGKFLPAWYSVMLCSLCGMPYVQFLLHSKESWFMSKSIIISIIFGLIVMWVMIPYIGSWGAVLGILSIEIAMVWINRKKALSIGCPDQLGGMAILVTISYCFMVCIYICSPDNSLARGLLLGAGILIWGWHFNIPKALRGFIQSRHQRSFPKGTS